MEKFQFSDYSGSKKISRITLLRKNYNNIPLNILNILSCVPYPDPSSTKPFPNGAHSPSGSFLHFHDPCFGESDFEISLSICWKHGDRFLRFGFLTVIIIKNLHKPNYRNFLWVRIPWLTHFLQLGLTRKGMMHTSLPTVGQLWPQIRGARSDGSVQNVRFRISVATGDW